jgi:hypothetical protein
MRDVAIEAKTVIGRGALTLTQRLRPHATPAKWAVVQCNIRGHGGTDLPGIYCSARYAAARSAALSRMEP